MHVVLRWFWFGVCVMVPVACRKHEDDLGPTLQNQTAPLASPIAAPVDPFANDPQPILSNSRVLKAMPSRALLTVRFPDAQSTREQLEQSAMKDAMRGKDPAEITAQWVAVLADLGFVLAQSDVLSALLADALTWHGECAIGLIPGVDAAPGELSLLFVGAVKPERPATMRTLKNRELPHTVRDGVLFVATSDAAMSEAAQRSATGRGSLLALGPYALASQSAGASSDLAQAFVNLAQVWNWIQQSFPQGIQDLTRRARLTTYDGLFYGARLAGGKIDEVAYLTARDRNHPLVMLLGAGTLDADMLKLLPADLASVSTLSAGQSDLIERSRMLLPADRQQLMMRELADLSQVLQVNLEGELRACLGSQAAYAQHGNHAVVVAALRDALRLQKLLQRVAADKRLPVMRTEVHLGQTLYSINRDAVAALGIDMPPAMAVIGNRLLIGDSADDLKALLSATKEAALTTRPEVAEALSLASGHVVSFAYLADTARAENEVPDGGLGFIRLADLSVTVTSRSSRFGFRPLLRSAGFQSVAGLILPEIENARVNANEQAAIEILHRIHTAQREVVASTGIDADQDGLGECAFLGELTGAMPQRVNGRPLALAPLKGALQGVDAASAVSSGYCFEVFLPGKHGAPVRATEPDAIDVDLAERVYRVYAWPLQYGKTGKHAFVMDSEGEIWATENDAKAQAYSGARSRPSGDAFGETAATLLSPGSGPVRQGRDGGVWVAR